MVRPAGVEPATFRFVVCCSIRAELRAHERAGGGEGSVVDVVGGQHEDAFFCEGRLFEAYPDLCESSH